MCIKKLCFNFIVEVNFAITEGTWNRYISYCHTYCHVLTSVGARRMQHAQQHAMVQRCHSFSTHFQNHGMRANVIVFANYIFYFKYVVLNNCCNTILFNCLIILNKGNETRSYFKQLITYYKPTYKQNCLYLQSMQFVYGIQIIQL